MALVSGRVGDNHRVEESCEFGPYGLAQGCKLVQGRAVEFPAVHGSDAEPSTYLLPGDPLRGRGRATGPVILDAGQEIPLRARVAPGISLEPPSPDRLQQRPQIPIPAGPLKRVVKVLVETTQHLA